LAAAPLFAFFFSGPLTALLTAGAAVSVPVIIHLLNRRRFRIVTWAAMRFLLAPQKKNSRRPRLEQLIPLAIPRPVALLLLLPMISVTDWAERLWAGLLPDGALQGGPGTQRTHHILVLAGSFSMAARHGETSCFEKARQLAARLVRDSDRGDGFSLVLLGAPPRRVVPGPAEDRTKVLAELDALRLPHGNSDLAATLETVADVVRRSPGRYVEKRVVFLSDMQAATWSLPQPAQVTATL